MNDVQFAHIGVNCDDPMALEKFYTKYFGFQRIRVIPLGAEQIVFIRAGNLVFELFKAQDARPLPAPQNDGHPFGGWKHLAFQVPSVDAKLAEMGDDARITLGPLDFDDFIPGWRTVWIADPEGNILEITQGFQEQENPPALT